VNIRIRTKGGIRYLPLENNLIMDIADALELLIDSKIEDLNLNLCILI